MCKKVPFIHFFAWEDEEVEQASFFFSSLKKTFSRIFDKDDDGLISVDELRHIMLSFGEKMSEKELDEMISEANCDKDGHIDYEGLDFFENVQHSFQLPVLY